MKIGDIRYVDTTFGNMKVKVVDLQPMFVIVESFSGASPFKVRYDELKGMTFEDECTDWYEQDDNLVGNYSENIPPVNLAVSETGSMRFNVGKPQTSELDPTFLLGMGQVLEKARLKYPRGNWAKGNQYSVPFDSAMRHLMSWQTGESLDSESGQNHLYHCALNLMMLAYYEKHYPEMDDRIFKDKK